MAPEVQAAIYSGAFLILLKGLDIGYEKLKAHRKPDLTDSDYDDLIGDIIELVQKETGAHRVAYWAAQNGEKTLDNYSIKKLSMVVERNAEGVDNIFRELQNVPSLTFKRSIAEFKDSDSPHIVSNESEINDDLGKANVSYGCNTMLIFKVHNIRHSKKWTGLLCIGFEERMRVIHPSEIGWCSVQVNRIETIISKI